MVCLELLATVASLLPESASIDENSFTGKALNSI
jgi:hypothetical protein